MISWLRDEDGANYEGYLYAFLLVFMLSVALVSRNFYLLNSGKMGVVVRKGLTGLVYQKLLRLSPKSRSEITSGKIVSLVSGDLYVVERGFIVFPILIIGPLATIITL